MYSEEGWTLAATRFGLATLLLLLVSQLLKTEPGEGPSRDSCRHSVLLLLLIIIIFFLLLLLLLIILLGLQSRFCTTVYTYYSHNAHGYNHSLDN